MTEEETQKEGKLIVGPWKFSNDVSCGTDFSRFPEPKTEIENSEEKGMTISERIQKINAGLGRAALKLLEDIARGQELTRLH
jgi:hypothetical protein